MIVEAPTLRLHVEDEFNATMQPMLGESSLQQVIELFPQITGWEVELGREAQRSHSPKPSAVAGPSQTLLQSLSIVDMSAELLPGERCSSRELCDSFVDAINGMVHQLHQSQKQLEKLNADLATAIPVSAIPDKDGDTLLENLEGILQQGLHGLNLTAASIYLLDDATQELNLRIQVGLSVDRLLDEPRPLKNAKADLEALVGNTLAISNSADHQDWNLPESFPSAICISISTHSTPLGTLWLYSENERKFSHSDLAIAELISGRVSAEIEREAAIREGSISKRVQRDIDRAKVWQQMQHPVCCPEIDQWQTAGKSFLEQGLGGTLHDLSVAPNGLIIGSVGDIGGAVFESCLGAATLRGAMKSLDELYHPPAQFLQAVNNTLWSCPLGDQIASLFHIQIEPETGIAKWANAGQTGAVILGSGAESEIAIEGSPLGACEDEIFECRERVILPNSTFFAFNDGFRQLIRHQLRGYNDFELVELMQALDLISPERIESWILELIENYSSYRTTPDVCFIAIHRSDAT